MEEQKKKKRGRKRKPLNVTWEPVYTDKNIAVECIKIILGPGWVYINWRKTHGLNRGI